MYEKIKEGTKITLVGFGKQITFLFRSFNKYANALVVETDQPVSRYWLNTMKGERAITLNGDTGIYRFDGNLKPIEYIEYIVSWMKTLAYDSKQIVAYNWFIGKLIEVKVNKISTTNLRVYSMIARHMLDGIDEKEKRMIFDLMLDKGAELVDMKQCEWQELCISQESQLPF